MQNWLSYIVLFIRRDLHSLGGGRTLGEVFFQSLLPILGTVLMLSALCAGGITVLGFYNGYRHHLKELESDPSSSAISLEGHFRTDAPLIDLDSLVWDTKTKRFKIAEQPGPSDEKIVRFFSPYRQRGLFFVDRDGFLASAEAFWGTTVKTEDEYTRKSVMRSFVFPGQYVDSKDEQGIILSLSLYNSLGYETAEAPPQVVRILAPHLSTLPSDRLKGERSSTPLAGVELAEETVSLPLLGVSRTLPDGSFIMTEGLFWNLQERGGVYDKGRTVSQFSIEFQGASSEVLGPVSDWVEGTFGGHVLKHPPVVTKDMGTQCIVVTFRSMEDLVQEQGEDIRGQLTAGRIEYGFHAFFDPLGMQVSLNLGRPTPYRGQIESYNGMMLFLHNLPEAFESIDNLYFLLKRHNIYVNTHQLETIKKYRHDMNLISTLLPVVWGSCILLIVIYILVSFTLFVQNKRHKIGVTLALGATSGMTRMIYLIETSIVFCISYAMALAANFVFSTFFIREKWPFIMDSLYNVPFFASSFVMANLAGILAVNHTIKQMPLDLITFRE